MGTLPHPLGLHRVVSPSGVLPQPAQVIDNAMPMQANELLIAVDALNVDAASFVQISQAVGGDPQAIGERVLEIVHERGKLHNPVTGSGGMLIGRVKRSPHAHAGQRHRSGLSRGRAGTGRPHCHFGLAVTDSLADRPDPERERGGAPTGD